MLIVLCNLTICCTSKSIGHCPACCPSPCLSHYPLYLQIQVRSSVVHACFLFPCPFPMSVLVPLFQAYYSCPCSLSLCFCLCPYPSVPVSQFLSLTHCPSPSVPFLISVLVPMSMSAYICPCPQSSSPVSVFLSLSNCLCHSGPVPFCLQQSLSLFPCPSVPVSVPFSFSGVILFLSLLQSPCPVTPLSALHDYQASAVMCMRFHLA